MDLSTYNPVAVDECGEMDRNKKAGWKHFLRQLIICTGVWTSYFVYGLNMGAPTVFIPQIRREANSTDAVSDEMASWLTSMIGFSGFPWVFILTILIKQIGRKVSFIISSIDVFIVFIILYCSSTVIQILISEILLGLFNAAQIVVSIIILTEYISPKYRGVFMTLKCAIYFWGIWAANALGTFFHWKTITIVGIVCSSYILLSLSMWPESPYWLASKERYEECAASHRWLKGCDEESEKELENLISSQKEYVKSSSKGNVSLLKKTKDLYNVLTSTEFYKPVSLSLLTGSLSLFSGKLVCTVYAVDIIKKITNSEPVAYKGMLILDGITILGMYIGCILTKFLKRRTLILVFSSLGVIFLLIFSLYLYLIHLSIVEENNYISICLLICFSLAIGCGPLIMSTSVYAELIPIRSRNLAICVIAIVGKLMIGTFLKVAPYVFKAFGLHGAFLVFSIGSSICITLLYLYLPETKDKTLQEVADNFTSRNKRKPVDESANLVRD